MALAPFCFRLSGILIVQNAMRQKFSILKNGCFQRFQPFFMKIRSIIYARLYISEAFRSSFLSRLSGILIVVFASPFAKFKNKNTASREAAILSRQAIIDRNSSGVIGLILLCPAKSLLFTVTI